MHRKNKIINVSENTYSITVPLKTQSKIVSFKPLFVSIPNIFYNILENVNDTLYAFATNIQPINVYEIKKIPSGYYSVYNLCDKILELYSQLISYSISDDGKLSFVSDGVLFAFSPLGNCYNTIGGNSLELEQIQSISTV